MQVRDFFQSFDTDVIKNKQKRVFFLGSYRIPG